MIVTEEKNIIQAKISIKALLVAWLSIPALYILPYIFVYLPNYISMKIKGEIEKAMLEAANLGEKISVSDVIKNEIYGNLPPIIPAIIEFFAGLLFFAWLCWAIVYSIRHFKNELRYDENKLYGRTGKKEVTIPLNKINNIYIEDSLWGRLFNYGTITVVASCGSISVKNIANARSFAKQLASVTIEDENNFTNL